MSINQFNGEWVCREDRVFFRFNTHQGQEFSFWLTRYVLKGLLGGAQQLSVQALAQWGVGLVQESHEAAPPADACPRVVH